MASPRRSDRKGRTWPERLAITATIVAAVICFLGAAGLAGAYMIWSDRDTVAIVNPAEVAQAETTTTVAPPAASTEGEEAAAQTTVTAAPTTAPPETFPPADPTAKNFLITGADNGACVDPSSPFFGAFGTEGEDRVGERSDTIMVLRVDPAASRVAVLSFPRDLYVTIAGAGNRARINSAYRRDEPQRLIDTIYENFGVGIDHFIQVDFCTFKTLVDAVGGVSVPFEYPADDEGSGLDVTAPGCFTFDGDHALAYVRSRHYEYEDPPGSGNWESDPSSDLGRISRQQDFLRRTLSSILTKGLLDPGVARGLIETATGGEVVTDPGLSLAKLMEFAGVMRNVQPGSIPTYQIEAAGREVNGASVLEPQIDGDNMQAVLAMFRGETSLADAPVQVFETTAPVDTAEAAEAPPDAPEENTFGIVPPRDVQC